jgi:hypothetical protein
MQLSTSRLTLGRDSTLGFYWPEPGSAFCALSVDANKVEVEVEAEVEWGWIY